MLYLAYFTLYAIHFLFGASLYSFLTVVAERLIRGETVISGRSHCTSCGHTLSAPELIPVLGFLCLRGKCKHCGARIPPRCLITETLGGLSVIAGVSLYGYSAQCALALAVMGILTVISLIDIDIMEIWDRFVVALLVCALPSVFLYPEIGLLSRVIGAVSISVPMLILALLIPGGFGGGDIKMMFAIGFLLGWEKTLCAAFLGILGAGTWGIILLLRKKVTRTDHFALGPFLCAGAAISMLWGDALIGWYLGFLT